MGLNWEKGLAGAAHGVGVMREQNNMNIDLLYKEVSETNRQRFANQQAADDRQFKAEQNDLDRELKTKELDARTEETKENRLSREADRERNAQYQQDTLEERKQNNALLRDQQAQNTSIRSEEAETRKAEALSRKTEALESRYQDMVGGINGIQMSPEQKSELRDNVDRQIREAEIQIYEGNEALRVYKAANKKLEGSPVRDEVAYDYATTTPDNRTSIDARVKELEKAGATLPEAFTVATDEVLSGSRNDNYVPQSKRTKPKVDAPKSAIDTSFIPPPEEERAGSGLNPAAKIRFGM